LGNIEPSCQPSGGFPKFTRFPRPAAKKPQTKEVWFCDDLQEFIELYNPENRHKHKETWHADNNPGGSWRKFSYKEITDRDQYSLDILSLKDAHMTDLDNLPAPEVIAEEIFEIIQVALASFREVANELKGDRNRLSS
jgi:type I restriction enzyme M protein